MLQLLSAAGTAISAVIGVLAAGLVIFTVVWHIVRKKQGKGGCDCGCSGCCSGCSSCPSARKGEKKQAPPQN